MPELVVAVITTLVGSIGGYFVGVHLERQRTQEWARKERWSFKRSLYEDLLQATGAFRSAQTNQFITAKWIVKLKNADPITDAERRLRDELDASAPELAKKSEAADDMFKLALQRAAFLGEDVAAAITDFRTCFSNAPPGDHVEAQRNRSEHWMKCVGTLELKIQAAAKRDFEQL